MNKFLNYYTASCAGVNSPAVFPNDPYIAAIKHLLVHELQQVVYYIEKLKDYDIDMKIYTDKVIEFISVLIVNLDFKKESFFIIASDLYKNKKNLRDMYVVKSGERGIAADLLPDNDLSSKANIIKALNDKEIDIKGNIDKNKKCLYEVIINLVLNSCNCLIESENYDVNSEEAKNRVLKLLNSSNSHDADEEKLIKTIKDFSKCNYLIMKKLYGVITKKYGPVIRKEVTAGHTKGKCILVSGSSLNELEKILKAVEGLDINVYTHYEMISAFQYTQFNRYKNLVYHYKQPDGNFASDFASFPGPIFISRDAMPKTDVIRGQIYTTGKYPSFGIGKIYNNDFSPVIEYALKSKGFNDDKIIEKVDTGYTLDCVIQKTNELCKKMVEKRIDKVYVIGSAEHFNTNKKYIEEFIKEIDDNSFVLLFSDIKVNGRANIWRVNTYLDFAILYEILEKLINSSENVENKISVFLTDCTSNTISHIFNLISLNIKNIFLGSCCPNIINPALIDGIADLFGIKHITTPKKDLIFLTFL